MSLCINPRCPQPDHPANDGSRFCESCGSHLVLQQRYRVLRLLSDKSGFGKVYEAYERSVPKILKVLKENHSTNPKAVELFQQEAEVLSQLYHPGIPLIEPNGYFQFQPKDGTGVLHCIIMEKIDGPNLREWMKQQGNNPISQRQAMNWLQQITEVLHLVHLKNYFHRDIKPDNLMLRSNGQLVLVDFGAAREMTYTYLAQLSGGSTGVTRISSAGYTPPEQEYGQAVPQSDFYALGRTFIYLLTAKLPTDSGIYDSLNNEFRWRDHAPQISSPFADFIDRLVSPRASDRPKNTQDILDELARIAADVGQPAPTPIAPTVIKTFNDSGTVAQASAPKWTQIGSKRWLMGGVAALVVVLGGVGGWQIYQSMAGGSSEAIAITQTLSGHTGELKCLLLGPAGTHLISGSVDATIRIWDATTGQLVQTLEGHTSFINALIVSPNGKNLVSGSADATIRIWDLQTGETIRTLQDSTFINTLDISPDGKTLVSGDADNTIKLWNFATGEELQTLRSHTSPVNSIVFTPDGKNLISGSADSTVKLWDVQTGEVIRTFEGHASPINAVEVSPDGSTVVSASADRTVKVWDRQTGELIHTLQDTSYVNAVVISPDGTTLISSNADGTIKVWDLAEGKLRRTLTGYKDPINFFVVDFNREMMGTGSHSRDIKLWQFELEE
ncbi:serine/threonine protein kinase [Oscillatoria sp. FACHB-1407]|uniref:WD40 repeat domain-containing serine/threonine-protein kinase n=1 Tax=Oscillatoria sp. FACHB-1407 TaxID=2692847 RepID=UPI001681E84C|nr:WD40 repeat domain-containing serine/threonine-protein kinase [Oscillatoria sp. FACHB-1407]MBD2462761.1 serine/threonine protein kinase [Oscillatoria sp. FACHB-1407]